MHRRVTTVQLLVAVGLVACGDGVGGADPAPSEGWRSDLYPESWSPEETDAQGRFLHDFSYAGYHHGELPLPPEPAGPRFDVVADFGADSSGAADATIAIQAAIDAAEAAGGGVVWLPAGLYRCDDLLTVEASGVVLAGEGPDRSRLFFSRHQDMSDRSHLTFRGALTVLSEHPLSEDAPTRATVLAIDDTSGIAPGDDVSLGWTISDEFVAEHGMEGTWQAFNGTWQPFFRRQVVSIDTAATPHRVTIDVPIRYPARVRDGASLQVEAGYLREVGVTGVGVASAVGWYEAWQNQRSHVLELDGVRDGWVREVSSFSPMTAPSSGPGSGAHLQNGGLMIQRSARVTVADVILAAAQNRGGGGCGYLFEIRQSSEILTRDSVGLDGRHNFIQNWGFGASGLVWLRCLSAGGQTYVDPDSDLHLLGASEFHHSLAMANLIDSCVTEDGWAAVNRRTESTGAGHTATGTVFWNLSGSGSLRSAQYGWGYVIGTGPELSVNTSLLAFDREGTEPDDWTEGEGRADTLAPASLYEDQLLRRSGHAPERAR